MLRDAVEVGRERQQTFGADQRHELERGGEERRRVDEAEQTQQHETGEPVAVLRRGRGGRGVGRHGRAASQRNIASTAETSRRRRRASVG
jgi:hypothetical protein